MKLDQLYDVKNLNISWDKVRFQNGAAITVKESYTVTSAKCFAMFMYMASIGSPTDTQYPVSLPNIYVFTTSEYLNSFPKTLSKKIQAMSIFGTDDVYCLQFTPTSGYFVGRDLESNSLYIPVSSSPSAAVPVMENLLISADTVNDYYFPFYVDTFITYDNNAGNSFLTILPKAETQYYTYIYSYNRISGYCEVRPPYEGIRKYANPIRALMTIGDNTNLNIFLNNLEKVDFLQPYFSFTTPEIFFYLTLNLDTGLCSGHYISNFTPTSPNYRVRIVYYNTDKERINTSQPFNLVEGERQSSFTYPLLVGLPLTPSSIYFANLQIDMSDLITGIGYLGNCGYGVGVPISSTEAAQSLNILDDINNQFSSHLIITVVKDNSVVEPPSGSCR